MPRVPDRAQGRSGGQEDAAWCLIEAVRVVAGILDELPNCWIARGDEIVEAGLANDLRRWKVALKMIVEEALGDADQG